LNKILLVLLLLVTQNVLSQTIENEADFNKYFTKINLDSTLSKPEKEQQLLQLLLDIKPLRNFSYSALVTNKLVTIARTQRDESKALEYQKQFEENLTYITSPQSKSALITLNSFNELLLLFNNQQEIPAINLGKKLLKNINNSSIKNTDIVDDVVYINIINLAFIKTIMGLSYFNLAEYEPAQSAFIESMEYYEKIQYLKGMAAGYNNISMIMWAQKDFEKAIDYLQKTLTIAQQINNVQLYLNSLTNKGIYHTNLNQLDNALNSFTQVLAHPQSKEHPTSRIQAMLAIAETNITVSNLALGEEFAQQALNLSEKNNNLRSQSTAKSTLGDIYLLQKKYHQAHDIYLDVLSYYKKNKRLRQ
jgi:tetratricopeptide (TPR) repeat protein